MVAAMSFRKKSKSIKKVSLTWFIRRCCHWKISFFLMLATHSIHFWNHRCWWFQPWWFWYRRSSWLLSATRFWFLTHFVFAQRSFSSKALWSTTDNFTVNLLYASWTLSNIICQANGTNQQRVALPISKHELIANFFQKDSWWLNSRTLAWLWLI